MEAPASPDELLAGDSPHDPATPWKLRFWSVFAGQALSLVGSSLTQFVLFWWITDTTGSISALATAGIVGLLPQALLGPLGGTFADRHSRRVIMAAADLISAACMVVLIALFMTGSVQLWHIFAMMFIRSAMQAFQQPAAAASTAMLAPESFLTRAAGLNQTLAGVITVAAAPLGALAISVMPIGAALGIDVATAVLGVAPLFYFAIPQARVPVAGRPSLWREFREGVTTVWQDAGLRQIYGLLATVVLVIMPSFMLSPLLVKEYFGGGAPQVALLESLGGGGMVAGGILVAVLAPRRRARWLLWGFALTCLTVALTALAPPHMFWLATFWWAVSGVTFTAGSAPLTALLQTRVPNQLQGRVLSLLSTIMGLAAPVGLFLATPLGELIGVRWLFVLVGLLGTAVMLLGFLSPHVRALDDDGSSVRET
ncbi:MAG: MFS transporter [Thermomicrobiales bacterium]|nr:MFS transporter [Thermomicrobiales bacterium]